MLIYMLINLKKNFYFSNIFNEDLGDPGESAIE